MKVVRLVKKAKRGSKEALLQLIMAEKDAYYKLAFTYMKNADDAMDVLADMIVKLYENINQLKKEEAFYSWSKTILVNRCKTELRKQKKLILVDDWDADEGSSSDNPYETSEQQMDIEVLLRHVNEEQKEAIQLKYFHDLDNQTIADMTDVPIGTVKSRVFQGLKKLREHDGGGVHG